MNVFFHAVRRNHSAYPRSVTLPASERGSTLVVSLIMLLLISLIGVSSMEGTILQERMASNLHDRNIAFQASEGALRVGEDWLADNADAAFGNPRLDNPESWDGNAADDGAAVVNANDDQLSANPTYHIGFVALFCPGIQGGGPCFERFSVTARGQGGSNNTAVILQSIYMPAPL